VLAPGVELKAERGIVLAPPSLHASGARYAWLPGPGPDALDLAPLPRRWAELARSVPAPHARLDGPPVRTTQEQEEFAAAWGRAGIQLEPGDRYYLCPFHPDHRPSLHVDSRSCRWYCFGCRRGGGIGHLRGLLGETAPRAPRERLRGHVGEPRPISLHGPATVAVVGEASHQDALLALAGGQRPYGGVELEAVAELVAHPDDPVEGYRVDVVIGGASVGRLRREDAAALRPLIEAAGRGPGGATCRALVRGGWDRGEGDVGLLGVVLFLPTVP
jgi:hypothetical protein